MVDLNALKSSMHGRHYRARCEEFLRFAGTASRSLGVEAEISCQPGVGDANKQKPTGQTKKGNGEKGQTKEVENKWK